MHRYFVTGTDTDVGKTRVAAALALALRIAGEQPTIVKLVQTGLAPGVPGDAWRAGSLAGVRHVELARFEKAADPWNAALAQPAPAARAEELAHVLGGIKGAVVAEGAGGLAVPINAKQNFADIASLAKLRVVLVVGLRMGCINHALLTLAMCEQLNLPIAGALAVNRWNYGDASYVMDVHRALQGKVNVLGILPFEADEAAAVRDAAELFMPLL